MKATSKDFSGQMLFVGIDTHVSHWSICVHSDSRELTKYRLSPDPQPEKLYRYLHRRFPGADFSCVYEAGICGFWIARRLLELGIDCIVVAPADVPTTSKERTFKKDPRDARKLARQLSKGNLEALYIPTTDEESDRDLVRARNRIVSKTTRTKNQIKSLLHFHGISIPSRFKKRCWSRAFVDWLTSLVEGSSPGLLEGSRLTLGALLEELAFYRSQKKKVVAQIKQRLRAGQRSDDYEVVQSMPGIGPQAAAAIVTEAMDIRRFTNEKKLASYVGLIPSSHGSGERSQDGGLTHRCNHQLRHVIVESAWRVIRLDREMRQRYEYYCLRMRKQQAIIRIARAQLNRLRYVLRTHKALEWEPIAVTCAA